MIRAAMGWPTETLKPGIYLDPDGDEWLWDQGMWWWQRDGGWWNEYGVEFGPDCPNSEMTWSGEL